MFSAKSKEYQIKRKISIAIACFCDIRTSLKAGGGVNAVGRFNLITCSLCVVMTPGLGAQESQVEPTWLHRYVPGVREVQSGLSSPTCHYKPIFGAGDQESRLPRTVTRFAE